MRKILQAITLTLCLTNLCAQSPINEGIELIKNKKYDEAKSVFENILKNDGQNAEAHYRLGGLFLGPLRDIDLAIEHLKRAVSLDNSNAEYHWRLGGAYGRKAQKSSFFKGLRLAENTKSEFERAVELQPDSVRYRISLTQFYLEAPGIAGGSVAKAKEQAKKMLKLDPCLGHLGLAQIAAKEKQPSTAEQEFNKAIEADPKRKEVYNTFGYYILSQKRYDEAIVQFLKYVEVAPEDPNSYDSLGEGYLEKGSIDAAIEQFHQALAIDSQFQPSIFNLGRCYEKKGMKTEAIQTFKQCVLVDPKGRYSEPSEKKIKELS